MKRLQWAFKQDARVNDLMEAIDVMQVPPEFENRAMPRLYIWAGVVDPTDAPSQLDGEVTRLYATVVWWQRTFDSIPDSECSLMSFLERLKWVARQHQEMTITYGGLQQQMAREARPTTHGGIQEIDKRDQAFLLAQSIQIDYKTETNRATGRLVATTGGDLGDSFAA